jgi:HK97 gp10 family phage protein
MAKSIKVVGIPRALGRIDALARHELAAVEEAVAEETAEIARQMRRDAPVGEARQGHRGKPPLAESIEEEVSGLSGVVKATAKHAWIVEDGTSSHKAQPFARPARERARRRFPKRITRKILKANQGVAT